MKLGELYKPVGFDCILLCVGPDTFTVEAGTSPFHADPLGGKITFSPTPPMHRAWHWSDLATPEQAEKFPNAEDLEVAVMVTESFENGKMTIELNNKIYLYENNL